MPGWLSLLVGLLISAQVRNLKVVGLSTESGSMLGRESAWDFFPLPFSPFQINKSWGNKKEKYILITDSPRWFGKRVESSGVNILPVLRNHAKILLMYFKHILFLTKSRLPRWFLTNGFLMNRFWIFVKEPYLCRAKV